MGFLTNSKNFSRRMAGKAINPSVAEKAAARGISEQRTGGALTDMTKLQAGYP
jgi:hypothetical protein